jgi:hypothetical protein
VICEPTLEFYFLGTIVSGLGTHNSNTSGRTNPTGRARYQRLGTRGTWRGTTKVQTANRVWQRIAKDEVECNLLQTQRPKRTDMRNDAMCNVQQYKWTFETSSSTQHLSTWIRRVPTYVRGRGGGDLEYHSLAASCGACHSEGTMASQAIESGERRVVQFVRLLVPSTPKASTSKASTPKAWGCATSAQLPKCLPNVLQLGGG